MKPEQEKLDLLLQTVGRTFGTTPRTPTDFVMLASEIQQSTGRTIGLSTLKRLWGYVKDQSGTTYSTLSLLSRYAGHSDWDSFCRFATIPAGEEDESGFSSEAIVHSAILVIGTKVELILGPYKRCVIIKTTEPDIFKIIEATNIKIEVGDTLCVACMAVGRPFFATDCRRGDRMLGSYTGACIERIRTIDIHK